MRYLFLTREMPLAVVETLPRIGAMVCHENGKPIAAGFLRKIEGSYGMFDGLISNPEASSTIRNEALNMVMTYIIEQARKLKLKNVVGYSIDKSALERSRKHGFYPLPHSVVALELGG